MYNNNDKNLLDSVTEEEEGKNNKNFLLIETSNQTIYLIITLF